MQGADSATHLLWLPPAVAFVTCMASLPPFIKYLKRRQIQQYLREEGPKSHARKAKTPTAGGVCFIAAFVVAVLVATVAGVFAGHEIPILSACILAIICGLIGFLDDAAKIRHKTNEGISARLRLASETLLGLVLGAILSYWATQPPLDPSHTSLNVLGITQHYLWTMPALQILLSGAVIASTTNAVNLHDGMDGLAAGTSFMVFATMAAMFAALARPDLAVVAATASSVMLAFLLFNCNPAKIFMGDTGSLFVGGLIGSLVIISGITVYFIPLVLIYIAEAVSVILQVTYFKLTKDYKPESPMSSLALIKLKLTKRLPGEGKRLFRMAPLHHHFEDILSEYAVKEWQTVALFWAAQALICWVTYHLFLAFR